MPHIHCSRQSNITRLFHHSRMLDEVILYIFIFEVNTLHAFVMCSYERHPTMTSGTYKG